jgi:hypothetical protein
MTIPDNLPLIQSEKTAPTDDPLFSDFAYGFTLDDRHAQLYECVAWCAERFGTCSKNGSWFLNAVGRYGTAIWFRDFNHAMEFKLTWK